MAIRVLLSALDSSRDVARAHRVRERQHIYMVAHEAIKIITVSRRLNRVAEQSFWFGTCVWRNEDRNDVVEGTLSRGAFSSEAGLRKMSRWTGA